VLLVLAVVAGAARADTITSLSIEEKDLDSAIEALPVQLDEPVGLMALAKIPKLGLEKGDIVRAINGSPAAHGALWGLRNDSSLVYLDVLRGKKAVVIRLQVKLKGITESITRDRFKERLEMIAQRPDGLLGQVTKDGAPSGVLLRGAWLLFMGAHDGDIVRKVDGAPLDTVEHLMATLDKASDRPQIVFELERAGPPVTATLQFEDPPKEDPAIAEGIAKIKKVDDVTYELPRTLVVAMIDGLGAPSAAPGTRVVPWMKDGKAAGFKFYAVRPGSLAAALGIQNGDALTSLLGMELTGADQALQVFEKLRTAKEAKAVFVRRGKEVTVTYKIK
jgi:general secretion pathway protein C